MGVLPLEFINNQNRKSLGLDGSEKITILKLDNLFPNIELECNIISNKTKSIKLLCRIDTNKELEYYNHGGILQYVLNSIVERTS